MQVDFFMGCNAPEGFCSLYGELTEPVPGVRRYLVKGGPGTGKSSLMRRVGAAFSSRDSRTEWIHCSSDPDSLDGVILHTGRVSLVDATPPHVIEPSYPGSFESVVNLLAYFDEEKLEKRLPAIVSLQSANGECHKKCRGLLKCAAILLRDNALYAKGCTDFSKADALAARLSKTELRPTGHPFAEHRRFLSAVTNRGVLTFEETPQALCPRIILLRDSYGAASDRLLHRLREEAVKTGQEIYTCPSPLWPEERIDHLFFPELGLGFVTQGRFCSFSGIKPERTIHYTRFTDMEALGRRRQYLRFNHRAAKELILAAVEHLKRAKEIHDELERQYTDAVDFPGVTAETEALVRRIAERYGE